VLGSAQSVVAGNEVKIDWIRGITTMQEIDEFAAALRKYHRILGPVENYGLYASHLVEA
jgi:hypothetical protein